MTEIISIYTGEEAVADGVLIDVTETAKEAGFKWPVRITNTVHNLCKPPKSNKIQSYEGRLWDVLWLAKIAIKRFSMYMPESKNNSIIEYVVKIGRKNEKLWVAIDGTNGYPAIHIMKPEDY